VNATIRGGSKDPTFAKWLDNGAGSQGVFLYFFSPTIEEELYFAAQLPHSWKEGTDIHAHLHWIPKSNGAAGQKVSWGLEYTWFDVGAVASNTSIVYGDTTHIDEDLIANKQYITSFGSLSGSGLLLSSMLACRVFRDATGAGGTDSYTADAGLLEVDFHYEINTPGSRQPFIK